QRPRVEVHVGHAEAHGRVADLGVVGDVHEVAAGRQLAAPGQAVAVHLGDLRLGQVPDVHPALGHVAGPRTGPARRVEGHLEALVPTAEVVAGGEARPGAADDRDVHGLVLVGLDQRLADVAAE